ncbi:MAG: hypothetical protein ABH856_01635 [Patescibacteria group bacterium]
MRVTVIRNPKESTDRVIARFNKKVQNSRKLLGVKEARYHVHPKTKIQVRTAAVMREHYRSKREKMKYF